VLVEEPENGIHPRRLGEIINLLRQLTSGKAFETQCQVILTTHSPYLLDHVNAQEDQVLVFQRQSDGRCTATPLDVRKIATYSDDFLLGEIWTNATEEGLVTPQKAS
jgi:predicted ATPase